MDDLTQRYYEAEMRYLREAGKEFAQAYPDREMCIRDRFSDDPSGNKTAILPSISAVLDTT